MLELVSPDQAAHIPAASVRVRHRMFLLLTGLFFISCEASSASPVLVETMGMTACSITAWSADPDIRGLNVRAAPRSDSPVLGRIPAPRLTDGEWLSAEVTIVGSMNGWFLVEQAEFADYGQENAPELVFQGLGWVSGRLLSLGVAGNTLHAAPNENAPILAHLTGEDVHGNAFGPDSLSVERVYACRGEWAEVEGTLLGSRLRGWVKRVCSNQVTPCS